MPTIAELCRALQGDLEGPGDAEITGVGSLENAAPEEIAAVNSKEYAVAARTSRAGALLIPRELEYEGDQPRIRVDHPLVSLNRVIELLGLVPALPRPGVHPTAVIDPAAELGDACHVGPYCVIAAGARIGARCVLHSHVAVESDVEIGDDCLLEPGAVIHDGSRIGNRVRIGAHAVLSRQAFGFAPGPHGPVRLHHVGLVVVGDDADLGAGTTIDRARYDTTGIGTQTMLDNQVHIAHNCTVGDRSFVAAQTGLAGRARIGSDCEVGGQVGIANECGCGNRCRIGAQAGVISLHEDGMELWGTPAEDKRTFLRRMAKLRKLVR